MEKIRCFLALPTTNEVRSAITALIASLQSIPSDVKWQDPSKLHLTLKFLGSVETRIVEELTLKLSEVMRYHSAFDIVYEGVGAFPGMRHPTIFWIGTRPHDSVVRLHHAIEDVVQEFGFDRDDREFHPHLTIGRVKGNRSLHRLTARIKSVTFEPVLAHCNELLVMRSDLHPDTSRYTVVQSIPLRS